MVNAISPPRCWEMHAGVLNLLMGTKVTSHEVGLALLNKVSPRVSQFAPDLIILSSGFDAHKADPIGHGALSAEDFGHITEVACQLAFKSCSGRVLNVLEGGYGIPCCRPQSDEKPAAADDANTESVVPPTRPQPARLLDFGDDLPDDNDDQDPLALQKRLEIVFCGRINRVRARACANCHCR